MGDFTHSEAACKVPQQDVDLCPAKDQGPASSSVLSELPEQTLSSGMVTATLALTGEVTVRGANSGRCKARAVVEAVEVRSR